MRQRQFHLDRDEDEGGLPVWRSPYVERRTPWGDPVFIHGYTFAEFAVWRQRVQEMSKRPDAEPSPSRLQLWQVTAVCRTAPDGPVMFIVPHTNEQVALRNLEQALPKPWIEFVCQESDALGLRGYVPPEEGAPAQARAEATLLEQLSNPQFWARLSWLSERLCGVPLVENRRPIGELLTVFERDEEARRELVSGLLAPMKALAGMGRGPGGAR